MAVSYTHLDVYKRQGPGWRVFNKGTGKGNAGFIGIADSVGNAGIGNSGHNVRMNRSFPAVCRRLAVSRTAGAAAFTAQIPVSQNPSAVVTHLLHIDPLIAGGGVAVVNP